MNPLSNVSVARWLLTAICLALPAVALGQAKDKIDDPAFEKSLLSLSPGFELQLVASEPTVVNPVQINFDPQGRLWVLCIPRYPQLLPGQEPADFVTVLEDFAPTGQARKATVFADGLTVPTGLAPGDGGVYIGQADRLLHLKDTRGTGKADQTRVLFAGFGTQDTHHTLNSFRWGPDGNLYFNQGVYIKSDVETPHGPRRHWGGGVWQLRPDRLRLEMYDRSLLGTNTWGHVFDAWGRSFVTTAWPANVHLVLPDTPLNTGDSMDTVPSLALTRVADGRHCGADFISGRHFPPEFDGNLVSGSFAQQLIYRFTMNDAGSSFTGKQTPPLVTSKHKKFRPVDARMGPDGALYIADWYNEIIQHNQIDFRDPRRDHTHGRIWRIIAKGRPLSPIPRLVGVPVAEVLDHLKAPEDWTRQQAKRALAERDAKEVKPALGAWVKTIDPADPLAPRHLLEALWTAQSIDVVDPDLLARVLRSPEPRARAAAARVAGAWADRLDAPLSLLTPAAGDADPRVRLEAVLALSRIRDPRAIEVAMLAGDRPADPLVNFAIKRTALILKRYWYPEFQKGRLSFGGKTRHLAAALQAINAKDALPKLASLVKSGDVPAENRPDVYALLAAGGDPSLQAAAFDWATATPTPARAHLVLEALRQSANPKVRPPDDASRLTTLIGSSDPLVSAAAMRLAGAWKLEAARAAISQAAADDHAERRAASVDALVSLGGAESARRLESLARDNPLHGVRTSAIRGLVRLDLTKAAAIAAELLERPSQPGADVGDVFLAFLERSAGTASLAEAMTRTRPSVDSAKVGLRVLNSLGVPTGPLHSILQETAKVAAASRGVSPADVKRFVGLVSSQGDPTRGEEIFRRPALGCQQCHAIGGAGGKVGPELTGIGASSQVDYLVESILLPDKVIREGYNTAHVVLDDGTAISGVVLRESPDELVLRSATANEIVVPKKTIEERNEGGSLMPKGLAALLTDAELVDLVRFLGEVGKPGPFAVSHVPHARRWNLLTGPAPTDVAAIAHDDRRFTWSPAYARVNGDVPLPDSGEWIGTCQVHVAVAGPVTFAFNAADGITLWLDGVRVSQGPRVTADLSLGTHTLLVRIDPSRRQRTLRCEILDDPKSSAQATFGR